MGRLGLILTCSNDSFQVGSRRDQQHFPFQPAGRTSLLVRIIQMLCARSESGLSFLRLVLFCNRARHQRLMCNAT